MFGVVLVSACTLLGGDGSCADWLGQQKPSGVQLYLCHFGAHAAGGDAPPHGVEGGPCQGGEPPVCGVAPA